MQFTKEMLSSFPEIYQEQLDLLVELAQIPAPSNHEEKRAEFCKAWLEKQGAQGVYIDEVNNVIYPVGCTESNDLLVISAHSDVVFPDTEPLPLQMEDGLIHCPGVGDDTSNVSALLMAAKYLTQQQMSPKDCGLLIVINAAEEGLGNLRGTRKLFETFGNRIREFIALDAATPKAVNRAVGSRRFLIEVKTEGGHSYNNFGRPNAIAVLASLIDELYKVQVPELGKTTYNVGTISGGTSVNTIAQHAQMLYEFRSDEPEALEIMQRHMDLALEKCQREDAVLCVTPVGDRPCGIAIEPSRMEKLMDRAQQAAMRQYGQQLLCCSASTDCNIPLSLGIPAICVGCVRGKGAHTREEYIEISSLQDGLNFLLDLMLQYF